MKIVNQTHFDTKGLRALMVEAKKRDSRFEGSLPRNQNNGLTVRVRYSRMRKYSGRAVIGGTRMLLRIPRESPDPIMVAQLFVHELHHIRGYRHNSFTRKEMRLSDHEEYAWAKEYAITVKLEPPKKDVKQERYEHALGMAQKKERAIKRLQHDLQKWRKKVKYYERAIAA